MQKRNICRSSVLQMKSSIYHRHETAIRSLKPNDLVKASQEETRHAPFSNPAVQALRTQLTAVRAKVQGMDESRRTIRSKIWGMTVMFNPPTLWVTINPSDTQDPIAQVMAGVDIDLNNFNATIGPDKTERCATIAKDPYAASKFFHFMVNIILEELFGIHRSKRGREVGRTEGIVGEVRGYIGTVEAQGRGTLHLHIILWLLGAPTSQTMKSLLTSSAFRDKVCEYISTTIHADLEEKNHEEVLTIVREPDISYSRPIDPVDPDYPTKCKEREIALARSLQLHTCDPNSCQRMVGNRLICKRRAPFVMSSREWIEPSGSWGPKRYCGYLNNWNPVILQALCSNHDIKLITNAPETKDITWYITTYATKKQAHSSNASALLATRLALHNAQERARHDNVDRNKRLLQRCANALSREQEFSAPEVVSYIMGWGDRYISHNFVTIYWDSVVITLLKAYPGLKKKRFVTSLRSYVHLTTLFRCDTCVGAGDDIEVSESSTNTVGPEVNEK